MENFPAPANEIPLEVEENDAVTMDKMRLSSLIKLSTTKSRNLVSKKQLPHAHHPRFQNRKPWRVSLPRLEKRVLVRATLDKALRVLSRHQSQLLNAGEEAAATPSTPETTFDDVDVGAWKLVKNGSHMLFQEETGEEDSKDGNASRKRDREPAIDNEKENNEDSNKRFKSDRNNNGKEEVAKGQHYEAANNAVGNDDNKDEEDDEDIIIDIESDGEPEKKQTVTTMNWQWLPPTSNQVGSYLPPPPPPISPPLPPHLLQPQPQPGAAFDYDYYFYCVRFFYHYQRFCAAKEMTESNNASRVVS